VPVHVAAGHGPRVPPVDRHVAALRTTGLRSPSCSRTGRRHMECRTPHASGGILTEPPGFPSRSAGIRGWLPIVTLTCRMDLPRTGREARCRACRSLPDGRSERHVNIRPCPRSPVMSTARTAVNLGTPDSQRLWAPVIADFACPTTPRGQSGGRRQATRYPAASGALAPATASSARRRTRGCAYVHLAQIPRGSPILATVFRRPAPRWRTGMDSCLQLLRGH